MRVPLVLPEIGEKGGGMDFFCLFALGATQLAKKSAKLVA